MKNEQNTINYKHKIFKIKYTLEYLKSKTDFYLSSIFIIVYNFIL